MILENKENKKGNLYAFMFTTTIRLLFWFPKRRKDGAI